MGTFLLHLFLLQFFSIFIVNAQQIQTQTQQTENGISFNRSTATFAAKLLKELSIEQPDENLLISPVSIQLIMGLLKLGADGITAQELSDVLVLPDDNKILEEHLFNLKHAFKRQDPSYSREPNITIANAVYVRPDVTISKEFHNSATKHLNVDVHNLIPFNKSLTIVEEINDWVAEKTHDQIKKVLEETDVTVDTIMLLINTLHFKGKWRDNGFNVSETRPEPFYLDEKRYSDVPMMRQTDYFQVGRYNKLNVTYLELPYSGRRAEDTGDYVFAIYLPDTVNNSSRFLNDNMEYLLTNQPEITNIEQVDVRIPRFKLSLRSKLKKNFENLGLKHVFSNAHLTGLTVEKKSVQVTNVIHNTALDVSEEGTEASAVTVIGVDDRIFSQPLPFIANRPFLFALKQKSTDIILFAGQLKHIKQ